MSASGVIRSAAPGDIPSIARLMADALADDPFFEQLLPGERGRSMSALRFFFAYARTHLGRDRELDVACEDGGRVVGVAAWTHRRHGQSSALSRQLWRSGGYLSSIGLRRVYRALRLRWQLEHRRPHGTHWWLSVIAVAETERRQGVGTALLAHRLAKLDEAGESAYTEVTSDGALALCTRLRFRAHDSAGSPPDYTMQSMTREARRPLRRHD